MSFQILYVWKKLFSWRFVLLFKNKKNTYCGYCLNLQDHFNYRVKKVCIEVENLNQLPFKVVDFKKYLYNVKAHPFFVFNKYFKTVDVKIDDPDYLDFLNKMQTD